MGSLPPGYQKVCRGKDSCGELLDASEFYEREDSADGLGFTCKACLAERSRKSYLAKRRREGKPERPPLPIDERGWKKCGKCKEFKAPSEFAPRGDNADVLRSQCHDCKRKADAEYRERSAELKKASDARYRAENKEVLAERERQWRLDNPEQAKAIVSKSKRKHKGKRLAENHARRARIRGNGGSHTDAEWRACMARYDWRCLWCGQQRPLRARSRTSGQRARLERDLEPSATLRSA